MAYYNIQSHGHCHFDIHNQNGITSGIIYFGWVETFGNINLSTKELKYGGREHVYSSPKYINDAQPFYCSMNEIKELYKYCFDKSNFAENIINGFKLFIKAKEDYDYNKGFYAVRTNFGLRDFH